MKPIVKNNCAVFFPQGFIDGFNANAIIDPSDISFTISKKPKAVFISLKKVIFFNKKGLSILLEAIRSIQDEIHCVVGFCEYDKNKYNTIFSMFDGELDFSLLENLKVLSLFFEDTKDKEQKILVYNDDEDQKNQLAISLYEVGHKPYVAKDKAEFLQKKDEYIKDGIVISHSYIATADPQIDVHIKHNVIFYNLKNFVDSTISKKFDLDYHENLLRIGFKVFVFDITNVSSMNIHGVNFFAKLSTAGAEYGVTFCIVGVNDKKVTSQLKNDLEDSGILLYRDMDQFEDDLEIKKEALRGGKSSSKSFKLTKNIVSNLNYFVDTAMQITQMLAQKKGEKKSVEITKFLINDDEDVYIALFGIYGHLEAILSVILSKKLILDACKIFIDDENSQDDIFEALAEYTNILSSKIKSNFKLYKMDVETTLSRVFKEKKYATEFFGDRRGVMIELDFEGERLKLFLSK
ncbi:MAG: chemotaxis protein CheX [Epsilonproteobacteria bacterium]|nr:chemotaxis protein CheX [Campylobacterota bacterium]